MTVYRHVKSASGEVRSDCVIKIADGIIQFVPSDPVNRDWCEYLAWLAVDGNRTLEAW